jgi:hypothetical protein
MKRWEPPARLEPVIYYHWIDENPKIVQGGELKLEENRNPRYAEDVKLASHRVLTNILNSPYSDNLLIYGFSVRYEGFKIVVKNGHGYLLMAHQHHLKGSFRAEDGRMLGDHPHFHKINYDYINKKDGMPGTTHVVPPDLHPEITPADLLNVFKSSYYFEDGKLDPIQMPIVNKIQTGLEDYP